MLLPRELNWDLPFPSGGVPSCIVRTQAGRHRSPRSTGPSSKTKPPRWTTTSQSRPCPNRSTPASDFNLNHTQRPAARDHVHTLSANHCTDGPQARERHGHSSFIHLLRKTNFFRCEHSGCATRGVLIFPLRICVGNDQPPHLRGCKSLGTCGVFKGIPVGLMDKDLRRTAHEFRVRGFSRERHGSRRGCGRAIVAMSRLPPQSGEAAHQGRWSERRNCRKRT